MTERQEFLYRVEPVRENMLADGPTMEEEAVLKRHAIYMKDLTENGIVQLAGRTQVPDSRSFGIVLLRVSSAATAERIMNDDPAVKEGVMRAELFPFRTAFGGK